MALSDGHMRRRASDSASAFSSRNLLHANRSTAMKVKASGEVVLFGLESSCRPEEVESVLADRSPVTGTGTEFLRGLATTASFKEHVFKA